MNPWVLGFKFSWCSQVYYSLSLRLLAYLTTSSHLLSHISQVRWSWRTWKSSTWSTTDTSALAPQLWQASFHNDAQLIQGTFDSGPHAIQRDWLTLRIRWSQREWSDFWLQKHHLHWAKRSSWMMSVHLVPITVYSSRSWTIFRDHWMLKPIWPNPIYHQFLCHWIPWISLLVGFFGFPLSWLHSEWLPLASSNRSRVVKIQVFDRALLSRGGRRSCCHPPEDGKIRNFNKLHQTSVRGFDDIDTDKGISGSSSHLQRLGGSHMSSLSSPRMASPMSRPLNQQARSGTFVWSEPQPWRKKSMKFRNLIISSEKCFPLVKDLQTSCCFPSPVRKMVAFQPRRQSWFWGLLLGESRKCFVQKSQCSWGCRYRSTQFCAIGSRVALSHPYFRRIILGQTLFMMLKV